MIWVQILSYFLVWSVIFIAVFTAYAKLLRFAARFSGLVQLVLGLAVYLIVACILVMPLGGLAVNETWRLAVNASYMFHIIFLLGYIISILPGALYFKIRYMEKLKDLGYFKGRWQR
ncbi:MAG: hypothetical protein H6974_11230 [Gammaproteobacteria bacterium]|nr:hypothetical protein [Gammaproteobacteria bacterium]